MISERIAVCSVDGNSLGEREREKEKETIPIAEGLQSSIINSSVSCLNKYTAN